MCGIAGLAIGGGVERRHLLAMADALAHRGPDGEGVLLSPAFGVRGERFQVGLAHRRLSVFDPSAAGAQPMTSRSGRTSLVLNGEIYNHPELRRRLPGFPWRTRSDTEVLLELLEAEGHAALSHLNGIFAFAWLDREQGRLVLARDRLGVKPLFYRAGAANLVFASELRALFEGPPFPRRLDRRALSTYLELGFVPAPGCLVEGVAKLEPGTLLEWREGETRVTEWWRLPPPAGDVEPSGWREGLYARLTDAVRLQLRSDVPVGTFLSGGVDSTLVTALAVRARGPVDTFSAAYPEDPLLDESGHARAAARALGTRHSEVPLTGLDARSAAPGLLAMIDEPIADSSLLPVHLLSRAARARVTVALAGDGADELFAGYRRYRTDRWLARFGRVPAPLRRGLAEPLLRRLPDDRTTRLGELGRRARKVLDAGAVSGPARALALARIFAEAELRHLAPDLPAEEGGAALCALRALRRRVGGCDDLECQLRSDLRLALPDDMLVKVDRASMACGLEVRVPFLDHRVVEHALALPARRKLRGGRAKPALLDVFAPALPAAVRRRRKAGFDAPLTRWLRGPLSELLRDTLDPGRIRAAGLLAPEPVARLVGAHESGRADHAWRLWSLLVLCDWSDRHGVH